MNSHRIFYSLLCSLFLLALAQPAVSQSNADCTDDESWISVGGGLSGAAMAATEMNGNLYVVHRSDPTDASRFQISAWDGATWTVATSFQLALSEPSLNLSPITAFQSYGGSLYMAGKFSQVDGDVNLAGFAKWDGSAWSFAGDIPSTSGLRSVSVLCLHNGNLIASGASPTLSNHSGRILQYDGTSWTYVGGEASQASNSLQAAAMLSWNGDLYVAGEQFMLGASQIGMVMRWDGTAWQSVGANSRGLAQTLFVFNNQLYAAGPWMTFVNEFGSLARWDGTAWTATVPQPKNTPMGARVTMHNGQAYMISTRDSASIIGIERFDGNAWHTVSNFDGPPRFLADYKGNLFAGGSFTSSCGTPLAGIGLLCNDQNCGRITGKVFYDVDANCTQDAGDKGLARRIVTISPGTNYAFTDAQGNYSRYINDGSYTVSMNQPGHWNQVCPAAPGTHSVTVAGATGVGNVNFGLQPIPGIQDLRVSIVSGRARQGRQLVYVITYENAGTVTMNGTVRFAHDAILIFDSADVAPSRYTGNVAEWDFTNLQMEERHTITFYTTVPISTPMNTQICGQIGIDPQTIGLGDDDRDTTCTPVTGGYDPNDISVTPFGIENNGVISPEDTKLTYWVRFQNTGNDTTFRVIVTDKLSPNLDISSIKLGAASHPFSFSIDKDNLLTWTFDNILLPDSAASQTNSNGFFKFSVNMKSGLPAGTQIANFVDIYFDYNAPVRTNTVMSIIGASLAVGTPVEPLSSLAIYPNPTRSMLHLDGKLRSGAVVKLRNLLGQEVARYTHNGTSLMTIDASALPAGTYLLEAETADGTVVQRISVVK